VGIFEDCPQTQEINIHGTWGYLERSSREGKIEKWRKVDE